MSGAIYFWRHISLHDRFYSAEDFLLLNNLNIFHVLALEIYSYRFCFCLKYSIKYYECNDIQFIESLTVDCIQAKWFGFLRALHAVCLSYNEFWAYAHIGVLKRVSHISRCSQWTKQNCSLAVEFVFDSVIHPWYVPMKFCFHLHICSFALSS